MALLGEDGRGYELALRLEGQGVWRSWLGDPLYANFVHFLSSPALWEAFIRSDNSKSRAQIQLQLRARALLFDKASIYMFLPHNNQSFPSHVAISKLNPNYLQLHGDDVYFTLENASQVAGSANAGPSKVQSKATFGSRYVEPDAENVSQRFRSEEFPETWYSQFFESYRASKPYRLSFGDRDIDKRTPEQMLNYLRVLEKHKRRRLVFKEDQSMGSGNPVFDSVPSSRPNSVLDDNHASSDETTFFPETEFLANCVPDSALPPITRERNDLKVEFNGVLDNLPQILTRSPIMIERLGIRPEYLNMGQQGNQSRLKNGSEGNRKNFSQQQASQMSRKVMARVLPSVGFEASSEVPLEVMSQLLSCHICQLGRILKILADSYKKQCSAVELLKMFLQTTGHGNLGALAELVKDNAKNYAQMQHQVQQIPSHLQSHQQTPIRQPHQVQRQMNQQQMQQFQQQMQQQMVQPQNLSFQQQQQWDKLQRRQQQAAPRPVVNTNMDKERPLVEVKLENSTDFPTDNHNNSFGTMNSRHPQLQFRQQQQLSAMASIQAQPNNRFRQLASLQMSQIQTQIQTQNMGMVRPPPVKVEGFQELMGGDSSVKHDSEENKLTSPKRVSN